jgi:hypothetical protein
MLVGHVCGQGADIHHARPLCVGVLRHVGSLVRLAQLVRVEYDGSTDMILLTLAMLTMAIPGTG